MKISQGRAGVMKVAVLSAAFAIPGTAMASAAIIPTQSTSGNGSLLGGNAVNAPISAPVDVCGNAVGVLGSALGLCQGGASVSGSGGSGSGVTQHTSGNNSIGGGNAVNLPVSAPVNVCGNAVGNAVANCRGGATVGGGSGGGVNSGGPNRPGVGGAGGGGGTTQRTSGNDSILGGNAV